jgi:hypothetical protein
MASKSAFRTDQVDRLATLKRLETMAVLYVVFAWLYSNTDGLQQFGLMQWVTNGC